MNSEPTEQVVSKTRSSRTHSVPISPATPAATTTLPNEPAEMSEKIGGRKPFVGGTRFRLMAILPIICSIVAFALVLVIVVAGSQQGQVGGGCDVMSLNMSTLGENVVKFTPATNTASAPTATSTAAKSGIEQGLSDVGDFFGSVFQNITAGIDGSLNAAEASIISGITDKLGVQESYTFYLMQMCSGSMADPTSAGCTSYDSLASGKHRLPNIVELQLTQDASRPHEHNQCGSIILPNCYH